MTVSCSSRKSCISGHDDILLSRYIGLQQGDPDVTFDKLPKGDSQPALEPGVRFIDLSKASYEELMELAAASAANPFSEMLSFNPGVLPSRLGYMTGAANGISKSLRQACLLSPLLQRHPPSLA